MRYTVNTKERPKIDIGVKGLHDILQSLHTLLTTIKGTVFLDRRLGMLVDVIDTPLNELTELYKEIYFNIEKYEPRVEVLEIKVKEDHLQGQAHIEVVVDIDEIYL